MEIEPQFSRRVVLGLLGGTAAAAAVTGRPSRAAAAPADNPVKILINGSHPGAGTYAFPADVDALVLDNGLITFTFGRDDAAGGVVTGWTDTSITATSVVVDGVELAHNLNGVDPRDPDRQHSFYIDAGGGRTRLVCNEVRVLRISSDLVEVAFVDNASTQLQHEHHLIMRRGKRGLYGYNIMTSVVPQSINEVRMNARWDRSILDHAYNWERGKGQQPTYAYLANQERVGDETWRIDGVNDPNLPSPDSNSGNLPPGTVYTKYNWSLYHHENPMFGHYGHGFGAWLTPLGGVSDQTLCAFYGAGPNHQDLAIHQDALILNYFGINHYGEPSYAIPAGYRRLYGPWYTFVTAGDPDDPDSMISDAADIARSEIAENRSGSSWVSDPLYPTPGQRTTVTGKLRIADGRPAGNHWVLLSTQDSDDVFAIHEPTFFVRTHDDGTFRLPGIPPAWKPGTRTPTTYTLYIFAAGGSVTDQYKKTGVDISGRSHDLGEIVWSPTNRTTFLWQIGGADRMGGEYALAANPKDFSNPRSFEKPSQVPSTLSWTVGESWEPEDWYYAQANPGTWTINFNLGRVPSGTAYLTVSSSLQSGNRPTVAVNGSTDGIVGSLPANNDSTIGRQADRSGFPRQATLSFPSDLLREGSNTVTLTRGGSGGGMGWDTLILEADEDTAPAPARLTGTMTHDPADRTGRVVWTIQVTNTGAGDADDVRLASFRADRGSQQAKIIGRDPARFAVPIAARLAPGESVRTQVTVDLSETPELVDAPVSAVASANGGRAVATMQYRDRYAARHLGWGSSFQGRGLTG